MAVGVDELIIYNLVKNFLHQFPTAVCQDHRLDAVFRAYKVLNRIWQLNEAGKLDGSDS